MTRRPAAGVWGYRVRRDGRSSKTGAGSPTRSDLVGQVDAGRIPASLDNGSCESDRAVSRLDLLAAVGGVISANIPKGFVEEPGHYVGMQTWVVPAERSPLGHQRRTVPIVALGPRKSYVSLFLMGLYYDPTMNSWLERAWASTGCPLDRGRVAIRLRRLDDVPLEVVAKAVSRLSVDQVVASFERQHTPR